MVTVEKFTGVNLAVGWYTKREVRWWKERAALAVTERCSGRLTVLSAGCSKVYVTQF